MSMNKNNVRYKNSKIHALAYTIYMHLFNSDTYYKLVMDITVVPETV